MGLSTIQQPRGKQFFSASGTFTPTFTGTVYVTACNGASNTQKWNGKVIYAQPYAVTKGVPVAVTIGAGNGATEGETTFGTLSCNTGINNVDQLQNSWPLSPYGQYGTASKAALGGAVLVEW